MRIKFLKNQTVKFEGAVRTFCEGIHDILPDRQAQALLDAGIAVPEDYVEPEPEPEPEIDESVSLFDITEDSDGSAEQSDE